MSAAEGKEERTDAPRSHAAPSRCCGCSSPNGRAGPTTPPSPGRAELRSVATPSAASSKDTPQPPPGRALQSLPRPRPLTPCGTPVRCGSSFEAGTDLATIALWLGHENPATTQICLHAHLALVERALARTGRRTPHRGATSPPTHSWSSWSGSDNAELAGEDPPAPRPVGTDAALSPAPHHAGNEEFLISVTTSASSAGPTRSSPTMPSSSSTRCRVACPEPSTTSPCRHS